MADEAEFTPEFLDDVYALFAEYVSMAELKTIMEDSMYEAVRAALSGATREEVMTAVQEHAAAMVTRMSEQMQQQLAEQIAKGLEGQLGPQGTARLIKDGLGLDSNREKTLNKYREQLIAEGKTGDALEKAVDKKRKELISDRAQTIAQTEMGRALEEGAFVNAKNGGNTHKVWITVGDNDVSEECEACQAEGPIPIDAKFSSGNMTPPNHPRCRCSVSYLTDTGKGEVRRAAKRAEERDVRLKEAREAAEKAETDEG
jgi:SPP1 gp7 family putative phage head morphogenesis protein